MTKKHKVRIKQADKEPPEPHDNDDRYLPDALPGQHFHMDFGIVQGSNYTIKDEHVPTIISKDGYHSYLLVIDRAS